MATQAKGGYEYDGKTYDGKFRHTEGIDTCIGCHNQHSLQIRIEKCQECHENVKAVEDLKTVRMNGSLADYNGNGDVKEGIAVEIAGCAGYAVQSVSRNMPRQLLARRDRLQC